MVARSARLADRFRELGTTVVLVNVAFAADKRDLLTPPVDSPNPPAQLPPDWSQLVPRLGRVRSTEQILLNLTKK